MLNILERPVHGGTNEGRVILDELQHDPHEGQLRRFSLDLRQQVVGQPGAIDKLTDSLSRLLAGIQDPERPLLAMLFMGPTGVGKTETVRALARILFGHQRAFTRINCQEFTAHFNISKLMGSPPGYVGGEIKPLVCQENLDRHCLKALDEGTGLVSEEDSLLCKLLGGTENNPLSLVLFDEIEKAHPKMWDLLLGILEDGQLILANNDESNFRNSIIILTTNVGSEAMSARLGHEGIGFSSTDRVTVDDLDTAAWRAARKTFPIEFLNRFDQTITFGPLQDEHLLRILDLQISNFHRRTLAANKPFLIHLTPAAKIRIIEHKADPSLGARPLNRALDQLVVTPLSHFVVQGKVNAGDLIFVDVDESGFHFHRQKAGAKFPTGDDIPSPPEVKWVTALISSGDDGGEKEELTEKTQEIAAEAAGGKNALGGTEPWGGGKS